MRFECPRCGNFAILGETIITKHHISEALGPDMARRAVVSRQLRLRQLRDRVARITLDEFRELYKSAERLPTPHEQANNLILWIGDQQPSQSEWAEATTQRISAEIGAPISHDASGWGWFYHELAEKKLFAKQDTASSVKLRLTMAGWELFDELKRRVLVSSKGFMAMKFGDVRLDCVFSDCFFKAAKRAGFELLRVTDKQSAGNIDAQMEAGIRSSRFLVADLTHGSHGAYWEAGMAHGLGIPVFYTCEKSEFTSSDPTKKPHFDTSHHVTILWDDANLKSAEDELTAKIRNTLPSEAKLEG